MTAAGSRSHRAWAGALVALVALTSACATSPRTPQGPAPLAEPLFYPPEPETPRIQFLTSFNDSTGFQTGPTQSSFRQFLAGEEDEARERVETMGKPYGVAVHEGKIFVCDAFFSVVHVFDLATLRYEYFGREKRGHLQKPINIFIAPDGTRYVADIARGQIVVFAADNTYLRALGDRRDGSPAACVVVADTLYVVDVRDHEVERRDAFTGELLGTFGEAGSEAGEFFKPTNIAADADGNLYVSDTLNCRVEVFDRDGQVLRSFGACGDRLGQFARPKGIAIGPDGFVYVVDAAFDNVQIFTPDGDLAMFFGGPGPNPGDMHLPAGVTVSASGLEHFTKYVAPGFAAEYLIIVVNQYGFHRVSVYAKGRPIPSAN